MELNGLTALVTGGAAGIGAGIAERLAAEGMHVVIADLDEVAGAVMAERTGGSFLRTDLANPADVRAAVDAAGPVAVLVNNAGGIEEPCFPAADPAKWEQTLDLNLRAVMLATQLVLAPMRERGGGAIINIASTAGLGTAGHDSPEYAVAKAGVVRFTACLAPLRDTMAVRVNCICPGLVDTPASRRSRARMTPAELAALPPVLSPADIAAAAMEFLADDTLAGRIMLCRQGGEPPRLLPVTDGQELPARAASITRPRAISCSSPPGGPMSWSEAGRPAGPPGTGRDSAGRPARLAGMVSTVSDMPRSPISGGAPVSVGRARTGWRSSAAANQSRVPAGPWPPRLLPRR